MSFATRASLRADFEALGIGSGDVVMVHAGLRSVGPILSGADALIAALRDALGPDGTLMVYTDWEAGLDGAWLPPEPVPAELRDQILGFDPLASRAIRDNGAIAELVRTLPGAVRSASPGASCAAIGARAAWLTADHAVDYGYGEQSPFARLVDVRGKVLMLGAPLETMTLIHHAEHLARLPGKRVLRYESPFAGAAGTEWRWVEEFDTGDPVVEGLAEDFIATIVEDFLAGGGGRRGLVGQAPSVLVPAYEICGFAVDWLEQRFG